MKIVPLLLVFVLQLTTFPVAAAEPISPPVQAWLAAQSQIHTWSADLVQTRVLKSLLQPLTARGRVWFEAPGCFRWELGQPPQTIAISTITNLLIIYPRLKRVESISLGSDQRGPWRSALDMLQAGFPRTERELLDHYNILSQTVTDGVCKLQLQPRVDMARRMMPHLEIDFDTTDNLLRGTELEFADGSTMRNDFTGIARNPVIDDSRFVPNLPPDYTVAHPAGEH